MNRSCFATYVAVLISGFVFTGCGKDSPATKKTVADDELKSDARSVADAYETNLLEAFVSKEIQNGGKCFVDSFNGQIVRPNNEVGRSGLLTIDGWAIDASSAAAKKLAVELAAVDGSKKYYAPAQGAVRPGLGKALGNPALDDAALQSTASLSNVSPGQYSVRLIVGDDKAVSRCDPNILLVVN